MSRTVVQTKQVNLTGISQFVNRGFRFSVISLTIGVIYFGECLHSPARADLPAQLGVVDFLDLSGTGISLADVSLGPNGNLWLTTTGTLKEIYRVDPVDGVLINGNDLLVGPISPGGNALTFDQLGRMVVAEGASGTVIDAVDGTFFNGNDTSQSFTLPWGSLLNGTQEPFGFDFNHLGILHGLGANDDGVKQLAVLDPINGDLTDGTHSLTFVDALLPDSPNFYLGMGFDAIGNLFVANIFGKITGIDPVDGIFFNANDDISTYSVPGHPNSITFDQAGNGYYWDSDQNGIYKLSAIPEPSTIALVILGLLGPLGLGRCRR